LSCITVLLFNDVTTITHTDPPLTKCHGGRTFEV
jgi:hypothetical protein